MASNSSAMPNKAAVQTRCDFRVDIRALDEAMLNEFFMLTTQHYPCGVEKPWRQYSTDLVGADGPQTLTFMKHLALF